MRASLLRYFAAYVPKEYSTIPSGTSSSHSGTENYRRTEAAALRAEADADAKGFFYRPRLEYDTGVGVAPLLSKKQFDMLYNVFHKDAVDQLNRLTIGTDLEGHNLDVVIRKTAFNASLAAVHVLASEHFNYCFWYRSLRPWGTEVPTRLKEELQVQYSHNGTLDAVQEVKRLMTVVALSQQHRCSWVYLVWTGKAFDIVEFQHGTCPIGSHLIPLTCLNIHDSAMFFDYDVGSPTAIEQYVQNYFKTCNWNVAELNFLKATQVSS